MTAPTMGKLQDIRYSHQDMIDYVITNPRASNKQLAARYGYSEGWVSNVMASDAWQSAMAARREEIINPVVKMRTEERFRGMADLSLQRLQEKLEAPNPSDNVVLKAVELGARALGLGNSAPPPPPAADHLAQLANRLIDLQSNVRQGVTINAQAELISEER
jgi:hypothetical protein